MSDGTKKTAQDKPAQRGLRLVKGFAGQDNAEARAPSAEKSANKRPMSPLAKQLSALADSIDAEVAQLLNL